MKKPGGTLCLYTALLVVFSLFASSQAQNCPLDKYGLECSDLASCFFDDVAQSYTCDCPADFVGPACQYPCPVSGDGTSCSGHGHCALNTTTLTSYCECDDGYNGTYCGTPICDPGCAHGSECIANYTCDCSATGGYFGNLCTDFECTHGCALNGTCIGPDLCDCPEGYKGDCTEPDCPGCSDLHGTCTGPLNCTCDIGWGEAGCATQVPICPVGTAGEECSALGVCVNRNGVYRCDCFSGYRGSDCSEQESDIILVVCVIGGVVALFGGAIVLVIFLVKRYRKKDETEKLHDIDVNNLEKDEVLKHTVHMQTMRAAAFAKKLHEGEVQVRDPTGRFLDFDVKEDEVITSMRKSQLRELFKKCDKDGDGEIDIDELLESLGSLADAWNMSSLLLRGLAFDYMQTRNASMASAGLAGIDGRKNLEFKEFLEFFKRAALDASARMKLKSIFTMRRKAELRYFFVEIAEERSAEEAAAAHFPDLSFLDYDVRALLSISEWLDVCSKVEAYVLPNVRLQFPRLKDLLEREISQWGLAPMTSAVALEKALRLIHVAASAFEKAKEGASEGRGESEVEPVSPRQLTMINDGQNMGSESGYDSSRGSVSSPARHNPRKKRGSLRIQSVKMGGKDGIYFDDFWDLVGEPGITEAEGEALQLIDRIRSSHRILAQIIGLSEEQVRGDTGDIVQGLEDRLGDMGVTDMSDLFGSVDAFAEFVEAAAHDNMFASDRSRSSTAVDVGPHGEGGGGGKEVAKDGYWVCKWIVSKYSDQIEAAEEAVRSSFEALKKTRAEKAAITGLTRRLTRGGSTLSQGSSHLAARANRAAALPPSSSLNVNPTYLGLSASTREGPVVEKKKGLARSSTMVVGRQFTQEDLRSVLREGSFLSAAGKASTRSALKKTNGGGGEEGAGRDSSLSNTSSKGGGRLRGGEVFNTRSMTKSNVVAALAEMDIRRKQMEELSESPSGKEGGAGKGEDGEGPHVLRRGSSISSTKVKAMSNSAKQRRGGGESDNGRSQVAPTTTGVTTTPRVTATLPGTLSNASPHPRSMKTPRTLGASVMPSPRVDASQSMLDEVMHLASQDVEGRK